MRDDSTNRREISDSDDFTASYKITKKISLLEHSNLKRNPFGSFSFINNYYTQICP